MTVETIAENSTGSVGYNDSYSTNVKTSQWSSMSLKTETFLQSFFSQWDLRMTY